MISRHRSAPADRLCTLTVTYPSGYIQAMEAVLRALADDGRRTLVEALASGPATAGGLAALLPIARPGGSRHLRGLRGAGVGGSREEGQRRGDKLWGGALGAPGGKGGAVPPP